MTEQRPTTTVDRLRHDIDRGRTGDKVDHPDPAAAPLGTDAEAGGAPPRPHEVAMAAAYEKARGPHDRGEHNRIGAAWIVIAFVVIVAAGFILWGYVGRPA